MNYKLKHCVIYFLYFVHGACLWADVSADMVLQCKEEYSAWRVFIHLLTPISCAITRNLFPRIFFCKKSKSCRCLLSLVIKINVVKKSRMGTLWHRHFYRFTYIWTIFSGKQIILPCFHNECHNNHFLTKNVYGY